MNISLTKELEKFVESEIGKGRFANKSEVIRAALRLLTDETDLRAKVQAAIDRGLADIDAGRVSEFDPEKVKREGRKKLTARKKS